QKRRPQRARRDRVAPGIPPRVGLSCSCGSLPDTFTRSRGARLDSEDFLARSRPQPLSMKPEQLGVGNGPGGVCPPTTAFLLRLDATPTAPLAACKRGTSHEPGELLDGVPFPDLLPLGEDDKHRLDLFQPLFQGHRQTYLSRSPRSCSQAVSLS